MPEEIVVLIGVDEDAFAEKMFDDLCKQVPDKSEAYINKLLFNARIRLNELREFDE